MRAKEWETFSEPLAATLDGFERFKFGFVRHHERCGECILAEMSAFSKDLLSVRCFVMPYCVPSTHLHFRYGYDARSSVRRRGLVDGVREYLPRLQALATFEGLLAAADSPQQDIHHAELRLCIALLIDDGDLYDETRGLLRNWQPTKPYEHEFLERCEQLIVFADAGDTAALAAEFDRRRVEVKELFRR